jgi:hypothetical protein
MAPSSPEIDRREPAIAVIRASRADRLPPDPCVAARSLAASARVATFERGRASSRCEILRRMTMSTLFLLSPARCSGRRADLLVSSRSSAMGEQLRSNAAPVGDVFTWLSALYFRGKLTYAQTFATPPTNLPGSLVMVPGAGLRPPDSRISAEDLRTMGTVAIESAAFIQPLRRDALTMNQLYGDAARIVLLGSIATGKYVDTLLEVFGARLLFPESFVGRGDMSRGGLLLRAARSGEELSYTPIEGATLHGPRPPKLPRLRR